MKLPVLVAFLSLAHLARSDENDVTIGTSPSIWQTRRLLSHSNIVLEATFRCRTVGSKMQINLVNPPGHSTLSSLSLYAEACSASWSLSLVLSLSFLCCKLWHGITRTNSLAWLSEMVIQDQDQEQEQEQAKASPRSDCGPLARKNSSSSL